MLALPHVQLTQQVCCQASPAPSSMDERFVPILTCTTDTAYMTPHLTTAFGMTFMRWYWPPTRARAPALCHAVRGKPLTRAMYAPIHWRPKVSSTPCTALIALPPPAIHTFAPTHLVPRARPPFPNQLPLDMLWTRSIPNKRRSCLPSHFLPFRGARCAAKRRA